MSKSRTLIARKMGTHLLRPDGQAFEHRRHVSERQDDQRIVQTGVGDLLDDPKNVQFG